VGPRSKPQPKSRQGRLNRRTTIAHSYGKTLVHCVFSTKDRRPLITPDLECRLFPYLGGIARTHGVKTLAVGGTADHVHLLLSLPATLSVDKAIQLVKGGSSKRIHDIFPLHREFMWQEGYGAFSIGISQIERTTHYIERQAEHHRTMSFQEEFLELLKRHDVEYDPRYVWG
jgi:REP-associated tyrosine transposase